MSEDADKRPTAGKSQGSDYDRRSQSESESQSSRTSSDKAKEVEHGRRVEGEQLNVGGSQLGTKKMIKKNVKKRGRRAGGVQKRKATRRARRKPKRRAPRGRVPSTSTIYARGPSSSLVAVSEHICKYCGHRCCLRRYQNERRTFRKAKIKRDKARKSPALRIATADAAEQAGSRAAMLSTLYIRSHAAEHKDEEKDEPIHCQPQFICLSIVASIQITPDMIHLALRELTMWRQEVPTEAIFDYIRYNYPVHLDPEQVMAELHEKLHIASIAGLIWALPGDCWRLTTAIERVNKLDQSHVTIFWKVYADTMKPLERKTALQLKRANKEVSAGSKEQINTDDMDII